MVSLNLAFPFIRKGETNYEDNKFVGANMEDRKQQIIGLFMKFKAQKVDFIFIQEFGDQ